MTDVVIVRHGEVAKSAIAYDFDELRQRRIDEEDVATATVEDTRGRLLKYGTLAQVADWLREHGYQWSGGFQGQAIWTRSTNSLWDRIKRLTA